MTAKKIVVFKIASQKIVSAFYSYVHVFYHYGVIEINTNKLSNIYTLFLLVNCFHSCKVCLSSMRINYTLDQL